MWWSHTHKLLRTWKVKQLYHPKVVACDNVKAWVGHTGTGDVCFVRVTGPDPDHLIPKDAGQRQREGERGSITFGAHHFIITSSSSLSSLHFILTCYVIMMCVSPRPAGPGNPVNVGLLCDLLPGRHLVHQSFISTCGYLSQDAKMRLELKTAATSHRKTSDVFRTWT